MKKRSGFTLLEVIIVIIIIGVLTSLALPRLFSVIEGSRATEALANIATLRRAVERYYLMNGTYLPPSGIALYYDGSSSQIDFLGMGEYLSDSPNAHFFIALLLIMIMLIVLRLADYLMMVVLNILKILSFSEWVTGRIL